MSATAVLTALISSGSALIGAGIGFLGTQSVARANRDVDRKRRSVDRLIDGIDRVEAAYTEYRDASRTSQGEGTAGAKLHAARRYYDRAAELFGHTIIRTHAKAYGESLQTYYLYSDDAELDPLDAEQNIVVPSEDALGKEQSTLIEKLRHYESN